MTSRCHAAISWREKHSKQRLKDENCLPISPWASAHRGKWGQLTPWKNAWKIKNRKHKSSFLNILSAVRAGRCRERRYADHIFIQIYFRMHHFVVKFSQFSLPQVAVSDPPQTKILRTFLHQCVFVTHRFVCILHSDFWDVSEYNSIDRSCMTSYCVSLWLYFISLLKIITLQEWKTVIWRSVHLHCG